MDPNCNVEEEIGPFILLFWGWKATTQIKVKQNDGKDLEMQWTQGNVPTLSHDPESREPSGVCICGPAGELAVLGKQNSSPPETRCHVNQEMLN